MTCILIAITGLLCLTQAGVWPSPLSNHSLVFLDKEMAIDLELASLLWWFFIPGRAAFLYFQNTIGSQPSSVSWYKEIFFSIFCM